MVTCAHHRNCKYYDPEYSFIHCLVGVNDVCCIVTVSNPLLDRLTFSTPRRPYERERLDQELRICGEYGLRCKREIWRVQLVLAKIRKVWNCVLGVRFV